MQIINYCILICSTDRINCRATINNFTVIVTQAVCANCGVAAFMSDRCQWNFQRYCFNGGNWEVATDANIELIRRVHRRCPNHESDLHKPFASALSSWLRKQWCDALCEFFLSLVHFITNVEMRLVAEV